MNRKQQGDLGVAAAIYHYTKLGYVVCTPLTDNARYDLIVDKGSEGICRMQVKTTGQVMESGCYRVEVSTQGGNQSWNGTVKYISKEECDAVFVYCLDGSQYELPLELVVGKRRVTLTNKLHEYKVKP